MPPWSHAELRHKLDDAAKNATTAVLQREFTPPLVKDLPKAAREELRDHLTKYGDYLMTPTAIDIPIARLTLPPQRAAGVEC